MAALEHSKLGSKVKSYVRVLSNWLIRANRFDLREVVLAATLQSISLHMERPWPLQREIYGLYAP